ncbi:MAG: histidine kinase, partial [Chitinophagaceae bacterium]
MPALPMKNIIICAFACLLVIEGVLAQRPSLKFKNLSTTQGLSINNATSIIQDKNGFIWIGTRDGLNKYDGYKFTVYRSNPEDSSSISANFVWTMMEDRDGNIWIGTVAGGLNKYDWKTDKFIRYSHQANDAGSLSHNTVQSII